MKINKSMINSEILNKVSFGRAIHRDGTKAPDLIDVILQNHLNGQVLYGASMNQENFAETLEIGFVVLYSKSRKTRWFKGETSGDKLQVVNIFLNCNNDQLLIQVIPIGAGVCHEKDENGISKPTCFSKLLLEV
ncbi:MAG: phosphoribosyl-AMP cyclohydrolase [Candidatus Moraniibacteriota bacterium]